MIKHVTTIDDFTTLLKQVPTFLLYKFNSRGCRVSEYTIMEIQRTIVKYNLQQVYLVDVITSKPLSEYIAKASGIKHESPQLIIFHKRKPLASASLMHITTEFIQSHYPKSAL